MYRILLVEDDPGIAQAVCAHLRQWELDARCVQNFRAVMEEFTAFDPQLVLLDISLPFFNGYHWCTQIRAVSRVPVVFLSSASENMNIVMAMNMGADDFIAKPFDLDVLTAKVQALLRRTYVLRRRACSVAPGSRFAAGRSVFARKRRKAAAQQERVPHSVDASEGKRAKSSAARGSWRRSGRRTASSMRTRFRSTWPACVKSWTARDLQDLSPRASAQVT